MERDRVARVGQVLCCTDRHCNPTDGTRVSVCLALWDDLESSGVIVVQEYKVNVEFEPILDR